MLSRSSLETQKLELMSAMSELKLQQAALERENVELRSSQYNNNTSSLIGVKKPPLKPRLSPQPQHTSTPIHHLSNQVNKKLCCTLRDFTYCWWKTTKADIYILLYVYFFYMVYYKIKKPPWLHQSIQSFILFLNLFVILQDLKLHLLSS